MSRASVDESSSCREIVELADKCDSKISSIEDDINKLFEAIGIGSSCKGVGLERNLGDALHRSAMKKPMRAAAPQVSGIGISEAASLKQALRRVCISQASEIAAMKKRMSRLSASPGTSEAGAIRKLRSSIVIEASEGNGKPNKVEISLIPERSSSNELDKLSQVSTRIAAASVVPLSSTLGNELPARPCCSVTTEVGDSDEIVSSVQCEQVESQMMGSDLSKQRCQNFVWRKNLLKKPFASKTRRSASRMGCEELEKVSPMFNAIANTIASSTTQDSDMTKHDIFPGNLSNTKTVAITADERSKAREKGEISQSSKSSNGDNSKSTTSYSEESHLSGLSHCRYQPHMSNEFRWEAISSVRKQYGSLGWKHFKLLKKIGSGGIAMVYLCELIGTNCLFTMKVRDNNSLVSGKKTTRAQTEKEILEILDHPFLPTLYAHFMINKFSCLVMEYCPGGDLRALQQKQSTKCFPEKAARFYAAEVLLALEYLHLLGVVYRDMRLENVLVREDGHIMLSNFDSSLRCAVKPRLLHLSSPVDEPPKRMPSSSSDSSCIDPFCLRPSWPLSCLSTWSSSAAAETHSEPSTQAILVPQLIAEPTSTKSNSFVGTPEYLAPEIIKGEDHGSAFDWWTFGIFLYELLCGRTPFKGSDNEETTSNVVSQCLSFPQSPVSSPHAQDLIRRLLIKDPENRLGSAKGAAEIKLHPFFEGLNWALIRHETPPEFINSGNNNTHTVSQSSTSIMIPLEPEDIGDEIEFEMF